MATPIEAVVPAAPATSAGWTRPRVAPAYPGPEPDGPPAPTARMIGR